MHLVVDHPGQQPAPCGVENAFVGLRGYLAVDALDAAVANSQVAFEAPTFIDHVGVGDQPVIH